jgi:hypothetical protein
MPDATSILEAARVAEWLQLVLNPLAAGGAHRGRAPDEVAEPFIVFANYPGGAGDTGRMGGYRQWNDSIWLIQAEGIVGPGKPDAPIVACADAINARLERVGDPSEAAGPDCTILLAIRQDGDIQDEEVGGENLMKCRQFFLIRSKRNTA